MIRYIFFLPFVYRYIILIFALYVNLQSYWASYIIYNKQSLAFDTSFKIMYFHLTTRISCSVIYKIYSTNNNLNIVWKQFNYIWPLEAAVPPHKNQIKINNKHRLWELFLCANFRPTLICVIYGTQINHYLWANRLWL